MSKGPLKNRYARGRQIRLIAGIVVGIGLLGGLGWAVMQYVQQQDETVAEDSQQQARAQARILAATFRSTLEKLQSAADGMAARPALADALNSGDSARIEALAETLRAELDDSLGVRLLPPGMNDVDNTSTPPIGYAALDMIRRAEQDDKPPAMELQQAGTDNAHILLVRRVADARGRVIGVLWMAFEPALLAAPLRPIDMHGAYAELRQGTLVLQHKGDRALRTAAKPVTVPVAGSAWRLAYWPQGAATAMTGEAEPAGGGMLLVLIAVPLLLIVAAAVFVLRRRKTAPPVLAATAETAEFRGAYAAIRDGEHPGLESLVPGLAASTTSSTDDDDLMETEDDPTEIRHPADAADKDADMPVSPDATPAAAPAADEGGVPAEIFRAYDIRGIVGKTLTPEIVEKVGQAIGSEAYERGQQGIVVGRDGRTSGPELIQALIAGLRASGQDVVDIGMVPTPVLYYATHYMETGSGVMLTGSHNPPDYNGLKMMLGGDTLSGDAITALYQRIVTGDLRSGDGNMQTADIGGEYIRRVSEDIPVALGRSLKVVVDCGNGVAGAMAPQLIRALGHDVIELFCDVDGTFPNHHPDPSQPENLVDMIEKVKSEGADLGMAFDGDGDRLGVVDNNGKVLWADRMMMLFARDVLSRNPNAEIIYDVKCTSALGQVITDAGGQALMWKTGHSFIKAKMRESGALLAGEMSGHIFFKERWYGFDDALYSAARLLEILLNDPRTPGEIFDELPDGVTTPELRIDMQEGEHFKFAEKLQTSADFGDGKVITIDGLRVEYPDGWGLVRPSNTTPSLILRFEGTTEEALKAVQERFRKVLLSVDPNVQLPF